MRTLQFILSALLVGRSLAAPTGVITAGPPRASLIVALEERQNAPSDFGTEIVTATVNGTVFTYTHRLGFQIGLNDDQGNEVLKISSFVEDAILDIVNDASICVEPPPSKRSVLSNETAEGVHSVEIRADDDVITDLVPDACFMERMRAGVSRLHRDPTSDLAGVIPAVGNTIHFPTFINTINARFEMAYSLFEGDWYYSWVPVQNQEITVSIMATLFILMAHNTRTRNKIIIYSREMFQDKPDETRNCDFNENAPACVESDCHGDETGRCTVQTNLACECWAINTDVWTHRYNPSDLVTAGRLLSEASQAIRGNPKCNGVGTQHNIPRDVGFTAINDFCGHGGTLTQRGTDSDYTQTYNAGTKNATQLTIHWGYAGSISSENCKSWLLAVLDFCDGNNPDNPGNFKHGGVIPYQGGASLALTPLAGDVIHCNGYQFKKWIDNTVGVDAINDFCRDHALDGHPGTRIQSTYNQGKANQVTLTTSFYKDATMSTADCIAQFRNPLDNCDHGDPNNPLDVKFGGSYTNANGIVFTVTPDIIPAIFPPNNQFDVTCLHTGTGTTVDNIIDASHKFCVDGKDLYSAEYTYGRRKLRLSGQLVPDPGEYKEGNQVCRPTDIWHPPQIIAQLCRYAMQQMQDHCRTNSATYDFDCVIWSLETL